MSEFFGELGKKLAERWLTLLVLPGILYLAVGVAAYTLGRDHMLDVAWLTGEITKWAASLATIGGQVLVLVAVLVGAAATGLLAQALGSLTERLVLAANWQSWRRPLRQLAARRTSSRARNWTNDHTRYHQLLVEAESARQAGADPPDPGERHAAYRDWMRTALEPPDRPTWSGDRINAATVRLERDLHLHLPTVWPYLWLSLPDTTQTEITNARQALSRATTLTGWVLLYLPLTWWWWPALPLALGLGVTAWRRTRTAADTYARLLEAAARLHLISLAKQLGIPHEGPPTYHLGDTVTHLLHTEPPPPDLSRPTKVPPPAPSAAGPIPASPGQPATSQPAPESGPSQG